MNFRFFALLLIALTASGCAALRPHGEEADLSVPENGFSTIVQQSRDPVARLTNPLYRANREIRTGEFGSPELALLLEKMREAMHRTAGIGISANQVGKNLQVFVIEAKPSNPRYKFLGEVPYQIFINPRITSASPERKNFWHGCLSAVGEKRGNVATFAWIEYSARNPDGSERHGRLEGLAAVIFQHEFRHMLGGTYLDHARDFFEQKELAQRVEAKEVEVFGPAPSDLPQLLEGYQVGESLKDYYSRAEMLRR
jgi:peptide deformylase